MEAPVTDDVQLIDATLAGDRGAFGDLVEKYQDRLFAAMVHITLNRSDAEDVVQEAFVKAFMKLDTFQRSSGFYTWLYRIAFNMAISRKRRRRVHLSVEQSREVSGNEPLSTMESATEKLERHEDAERLHEALTQLSDEHRAIIDLREMQGCDYETIGDTLNLPVGTVRSRLHRARAHLREILDDNQDDSSQTKQSPTNH